jgi:probable HAF family extracellular repeat protein
VPSGTDWAGLASTAKASEYSRAEAPCNPWYSQIARRAASRASRSSLSWGWYLLDQGSYTTLDVPGAIGSTLVTGINASGQIVGSYGDAGGNGHGFLLENGRYTTLDVPGSDYTAAMGINDSGQIVGYYIATTNSRATGKQP